MFITCCTTFHHASWLQFSLFKTKMVNHDEVHVTFYDMEYEIQKNILHCCVHSLRERCLNTNLSWVRLFRYLE